MKVLLSIKPEFVEKIINGEKKFEFRRKIFKKDVDKVVIYATSPLKLVVGEFVIEEIIKKDLDLLWQITNKYAGINEDYFWQYFKGVYFGYALKIGEVKLYDNYLKIQDIGLTPPQSYVYL